MKAFIYIAFIALTTVGVYAQQSSSQNGSSQQELADSTKELASKISQEFNFEDSETLYLHRAIYSTNLSKKRIHESLTENSEQFEDAMKQIDDQFEKMLKAKFDDLQITNIKDFIAKE